MEKEKVTKEQVIHDLIYEFDITEEGLSKRSGGTFLIDKREFERYETISKLQDYFIDKILLDGQCRIDSITLLYTIFHIEDRNK